MEPKHNLKHVAIIMDGNGRWAMERSHHRVWGHVRGAGVVSQIVEECDELGIKNLTLFAFSTENWARPVLEVQTLFKLLNKFIVKERLRILKNNIRFRVVGKKDHVPSKTAELIKALELETQDNQGLNLTFSFDYGSRAEIVSAINSHIQNHPGIAISEETLGDMLYAADRGEVDLLIRTGGDKRISNFMLWQCAYAELYFSQTKWPEFSRQEFRKIIDEVSTRERRFGGIGGAQSLDASKVNAEYNKRVHNFFIR